MTNYKFAIYSGTTTNSKPLQIYFSSNKKSKHLFSYAKTFEDAILLFKKADEILYQWIDLVCLTTLIVIKSSRTYDITKNIDTGYHSDEYYN